MQEFSKPMSNFRTFQYLWERICIYFWATVYFCVVGDVVMVQ